MKKIMTVAFFILSFYSSYLYAYTCFDVSGGEIEMKPNGTTTFDLEIDGSIVTDPQYGVINEYADMANYIECQNDEPLFYTDLMFMTSYEVLQNTKNVQFGVQIRGVNYFDQLTNRVEVINLPRYGTSRLPLEIAMILRVIDTPNDGVIIRKGDPLIKMNMHRYGILYAGSSNEQDNHNPWNYTWIVRAANDIILTSTTCTVNNGDVLSVDLGDLYSGKIPTSSGTMQLGKDLDIDFQCQDAPNLNTEVSIVLAGDTTSFSNNALLTREGTTHGAGNVINDLGVEIYHKRSGKLIVPNSLTDGFNSNIVNGRGNDTIYIAPIKTNALTYNGPFTSVATLIMSLP